MAKIQVAPLPKPKPRTSLQLLASLCFYYPQYTLAAARKLPYRHVILLLKEAQRQEAARNHSLVQIIAAPHTKDGKAVQDLSDHYRDLMNG